MQLLIDYINNQSTSIDNVDMKSLILLCKNHSLLPLLYKVCKKYNCSLTDEQEKTLKREFLLNVSRETNQDYEYGEIINALNEAGIKCMPMKGIIIKHLYQSPEERSMCDVDILYDEKECKKVKNIMLSLGYTCDSFGGTHDIYMKKPYMNVEMHRVLIDETHNIFHDYYKNIWNVVKKVPGKDYVYEMSDEDFYIYMIVHMARHFASGGIGFRYLIDVWLYLNKKEINQDYLNEELKKINLDVFENNIRLLTFALFKNEELSDDQKQLYNFILNSGTHGSIKHSQAIKITLGKNGYKATKMNRISYYFSSLFPPFSKMKARNHILKKVPILLPYFYIQRIFNAIFKRRSLTMSMIRGVKQYDIDKANEIKDIHKKAGV